MANGSGAIGGTAKSGGHKTRFAHTLSESELPKRSTERTTRETRRLSTPSKFDPRKAMDNFASRYNKKEKGTKTFKKAEAARKGKATRNIRRAASKAS